MFFKIDSHRKLYIGRNCVERDCSHNWCVYAPFLNRLTLCWYIEIKTNLQIELVEYLKNNFKYPPEREAR